MGLGSKVSEIASSVQHGVRSSTVSFIAWSVKLLTAFMIGFTAALIGQEIMAYGSWAFFLMMSVVFGGILKMVSKWSLGGVLLFDLICILVALLLRMYLIVAP